MPDIYNIASFQNADSPFTELFTLLIRNEILPNGFSTLAYRTDELKVLHQHVNNAIDLLLYGLQDLGNIIGLAFAENKLKKMVELENIGFFISALGNLTKALNELRLDTDDVLRQRGEFNY